MTTTMKNEPSAVEPYLAAFREQEAALCGGAPAWLARQRRAAIARFGEVGFPDARNEDWKFTSVAPIVRTAYQAPPDGDDCATAAGEGEGELSSPVLAFYSYHPMLQPGDLPAGVRLMSLRDALARCPELVEPHLGRHAAADGHAFAALNAAFWPDGAFVYVPPGAVVERPILIHYVSYASTESGPFLWYRRCLVVLGRGSQATVIERHDGGYHGPSMTNVVTEAALGEGARLDHYKAQNESRHATHVAVTQAVLARDSRFSTHYVGLGGQLVRNEVHARFTGENGEATVNGLYLARGTQHMDNFTVIDHARPHCASHELYKGVLDGKARGVFNGKIFVRKDAQKTDAKQTNQALLLSDEATINTKPQLEIFADDVKCTHGATVGQLDADQLFYLRARGIGAEQARALLTFAFANDIISRIRPDRLRDQLEHALLASSHLPPLADTEDE